MNRKELVDAIAGKTGHSKKDAESFLNAFVDAVVGEMKAGGSFKVSARAAREGRNPRTGEKIKVAARKVPTFKAGKDFKEAVN